MKSQKVDNSAYEAAAKAQAAAQLAANNLQTNFATDLTADNAAQIVAGGTADTADVVGGTVKKKRPASSLSSQLGIS